jgi:hypothetical protein
MISVMPIRLPLPVSDFFYDVTIRLNLKEVTNLNHNWRRNDRWVTYESSTLINGSTVSIPLKTDADATTFSFINYGSTTPALVNEDVLEI